MYAVNDEMRRLIFLSRRAKSGSVVSLMKVSTECGLDLMALCFFAVYDSVSTITKGAKNDHQPA